MILQRCSNGSKHDRITAETDRAERATSRVVGNTTKKGWL
jgi:hypothetical protein